MATGFVKKTAAPPGDARWLTVVAAEAPEGTELLLEPDGGDAPRGNPTRPAAVITYSAAGRSAPAATRDHTPTHAEGPVRPESYGPFSSSSESYQISARPSIT
ncbi:hypothetical protein CLM85_22055 [Streptomyces albidoflavus]|nr:hypothetical protein CLM85_22055 [Streptomyces albidoflavus]